MGKFVNHEALAAGYLNRSFNGGSHSFQAWEDNLQNSPASVTLMVSRMASDYERANPKMRKAWAGKDLDSRFLHMYVFLPVHSFYLWTPFHSTLVQQ